MTVQTTSDHPFNIVIAQCITVFSVMSPLKTVFKKKNESSLNYSYVVNVIMFVFMLKE